MEGTRRSAWNLLATMAFVLSGSALHAQQWNVDAEAGRIRSALDPNASQAQTLAIGLRYDDAATGFRLSGGIPTNAVDPLWGAVAGARRLAIRPSAWVFGVDVAGNALLLHDRAERTREIPGRGIFDPGRTEVLPPLSGSAFAAQAMPVLGYETIRMQVHVRAGGSHYRARFGDQSLERTVQMGDAQLTFAPAASFLVMPAARHYRADEGDYTYAGLSALGGNNTITGWATVGTWLNADTGTPWSAGATLRLHERAAINASVRHDAFDPLYLAPAQTAWNVGVSILIAGRRLNAAPVPARYSGGRATITLKQRPATANLSIAGDFNGWKPAPMQRAGDEWTYTTALKPGVYNYAFVDESGKWFVPEKHPGRKDDGMGGHVAVLVVEP